MVCQGGGLREFRMAIDSLGGFRDPGIGWAEGVGLTCLSVRCLSSYLIFSASSSDRTLGRSSPGDMRRREALHR